ncbi:uncharacterized protein LOC110437028 isoform X3 [Sorghum bicolor]|uniref:uncharacterized protein LOC110437028 isoform X3 n=1 Tax=Sorghum bicolor TaxID=4558 RepID=UPI000B4246D7|nr:uncharacterized protein LOC110437028 isoform X3 [Sorghum bicolor]|eukprot:XP_021320732.1 uncharacterized protein LOC110437028 isoform X3 [Sorghum bicolor]
MLPPPSLLLELATRSFVCLCTTRSTTVLRPFPPSTALGDPRSAGKGSCLGTLCRCETSCLQNATKTVGTQLAKGEATESKWMFMSGNSLSV